MKLEITNSFCHVHDSSQFTDNVIWAALSWEPSSARFLRKKFGHYRQPPRSHYDRKTKTFLSGLHPIVTAALEARKIPFKVEINRKAPSVASKSLKPISGINLYDYQKNAAEAFLGANRGILKLSTGAGKTLLAKSITKALNVPTIFFTHRTNLLYQTAKRFEKRLPEYKGKFGIIGGGEFSPNFITFATVQTVARRLKDDPDMKALLEMYELVIVDEAHKFSSEQFVKAISACTNAYYRLGLTATPFMRGDKNEEYNLRGSIGDVIYEVTNSDLISRGLLARPYVKYIEMTSDKPLDDLSDYREVYSQGVVNNKIRNVKIVDVVNSLKKKKPKILVVTSDVSHANLLQKMISDSGVKSELCTGATDAKTRQKSLAKLEKGRIDCIVASTIFDEGINIESLGSIVLAAGGKSVPALYQRIGRTMRKKGEEENYCIVVDFIDRQHGILLNQSKQRLKIIKGEKEFRIL